LRVSYDPESVASGASERGAVVSIGVFDGVHLGHQAILAANRNRARELAAAPTVVTFRGHPKGVLLGHAPRTLTSLDHRLDLFRRAGIEHALVLTFDEHLRDVSAEEFVDGLLVQRLAARAFVLGFDSKFGHDRRGTPAWLRERGFDVTVVDKVQIGERAVSSTAIREAVELGDLDGARRMLGRPVSVLGTVVRGDALGHTLGFPTANLDLHHELHPPRGVYYGWARVVPPSTDDAAEGELRYPAVANIGFRPTIAASAPPRARVEAHLIDFEGDLYGRNLELAFLGRLRAEQRFNGPDELRAQIARDVAAARGKLATFVH
jgi:riboflavin kinase/FMN adenylyltransferase